MPRPPHIAPPSHTARLLLTIPDVDPHGTILDIPIRILRLDIIEDHEEDSEDAGDTRIGQGVRIAAHFPGDRKLNCF